ncbi:carboxyl transferase domain-containing protein [Leucobacter japonicus]|uniref:carboxyl transferase domain-containing protein n=1 Tax=Leucobacter japonicus TaxID=1461259 RepID=UPI0006A7C16B|nr:carboxyl transferase domain-containing protein [Leucobacter japonicus]
MHESADTSAGPGAIDAPLENWAAALLGTDAIPLAANALSAAWTGNVADTPVVLVVERGTDADPLSAHRAVDFATRTGTPLVTVLIDGGALPVSGQLASVHLLSGVVPHLAIETGRRTTNGRLRAAAADFSTAVTVEREVDAPHFSQDHDAVEWVASILRRLPANRTLPAPIGATPATRVSDRSLAGTEDPVTVIDRVVDDAATVITAASAALQCGFASLDGHTIGTISSTTFAGDGAVSAGDLRATARFLSFCDAFRLPVIAVLDVPGLDPETGGSAVNPLARALAEAAIPIAALITRRLGAPLRDLLGDPELVPELLAWPDTVIKEARTIDATRTADELLAALVRWSGIDAPVPARRNAVAAR